MRVTTHHYELVDGEGELSAVGLRNVAHDLCKVYLPVIFYGPAIDFDGTRATRIDIVDTFK